MKIIIATPCFGGQIHSPYAGCLINTLKYFASQRIEAELYFLSNSSSIGYARNNCAAYALEREADRLFFIDADQAWTDEDVSRILRSKRKIIGGTYAKKEMPWNLNFNPLPEHRDFFPSGSRGTADFAAYMKLADAEGEIEVSHVPTGFLMIEREVLEAVKPFCPTYLAKENQHAEEKRYWDMFPSGVLNGRYETEDFFFCSIARDAGFPAYLNVRTIIDHYGQFNYRIPKNALSGMQGEITA